MTPIIPEQLIDRCRKGDRTAQTELYSLLFRPVYSSAFRITRSANDAEEIAQEAFLKVFRDIDRYRDRLCAALRRIAINASIDLLRKRRVNFVEMSPRYDVTQEEVFEPIEPDIEAIKAAIEELPAGYRLVITLRLIEGLDFEEIAREMCINSSTARSQFVRGKQKIIEIVNSKRRCD